MTLVFSCCHSTCQTPNCRSFLKLKLTGVNFCYCYLSVLSDNNNIVADQLARAKRQHHQRVVADVAVTNESSKLLAGQAQHDESPSRKSQGRHDNVLPDNDLEEERAGQSVRDMKKRHSRDAHQATGLQIQQPPSIDIEKTHSKDIRRAGDNDTVVSDIHSTKRQARYVVFFDILVRLFI